MRFCTPIFFGSPRNAASKINNGTATLIRFRDNQLAVTNQHVIYEYRKRIRSEKNIALYIGNFEIHNLNDVLVYEDKDMDLCIINLEHANPNQLQLGHEVPTEFYGAAEFEDFQMLEESVVVFGGYPGILREKESPTDIVFGTASSGGGRVITATDRNILFEGLRNGAVVFNHNNFTPIDFGGMSGGPILLRDSTDPMNPKFALIGIIYQYTSPTDTFYARPLHLLNQVLAGIIGD